MKKITLFLLLISTPWMGFSQQETFNVTFETGTDGSTASIWSTFENDSNPSIEIVANPDATGANVSATVAKFTALDTGKPWAGAQTTHKGLGEWILETGNSTISLLVYKTVISDVGVKFVNSTSGTVFELKQANTIINAWEKLTFDISSFITHGENHNIDQLVVFPDWPSGDRVSDNIVYFDDITWDANRTANASGGDGGGSGGGGGSPAPTTAPTAPTATAVDVISLFSDEYTDVAATWNPGWGQSTVVEEETIAGNPLKKYSSFTFSGVEPTGGTIDASAMTHINIDYWTSDATELKIKLVDYNGDGTWGSDNTEVEITKSITKDSWGTVSIPLSEFTDADSGISFNDIGQLVLSATGATNPVYLDNFYFSKPSGGGGSTVALPLDFESATTWVDFDGGAVTTIANPQSNSDNNSANVGLMVKSASQTWGGSSLTLSSAIDFANNDTFTMKVYSPRVGAKVLLKVENSGDADIKFEKEVVTTVANGWETLTFDYSAINVANSYDKLIVIFDNGTMGDGSANFTFYIDDIVLSKSGVGGSTVVLPLDFESATTWVDFDGGAVTTITNPQSNSDNSSANVGQMVKSAGQTWGGSSIALSSAIDFANNDTFTMKVFSPRVGAKVLLKVENSGDADIKFEKEVVTTVANGWETLTFDYSAINVTNSYDKLIVIFDNGTMGDGSANFTFYIDDIVLSKSGGTGPTIALPLDFESATTWVDFDGGVVTTISNPHSDSNNNSANVGQMVKSAGQTWGGSSITLSSALDFENNDTFTMKVYSPRIGAKVLLKVENSGDGNIKFEKEVTTTVANDWEVLTFNYAAINTTNSYDKLVIIFDLGTMGDGSANFTFYIDDIVLSKVGSGGTQMDLPVTFEDSAVEYGVIGFEGAILSLVTNPDATGNNTSANVVKFIKPGSAGGSAGATVTAAAELGFKTAIPFSVTDTKMTVAVWSPDSGIQVRLKAEDHADITHTVEAEATTTVAGGWEVLEFDFSNQAAGTESLTHGLNNGWKYDKVSIFFNFGVDGATAGEKTYYFDNMNFGDLASLSVKDVNLFEFKIYPNPVGNLLFISAKETIDEVGIYNILGKEVKKIKVKKNKYEINISDLKAGMYFLKYTINNTVRTKKIIKK